MLPILQKRKFSVSHFDGTECPDFLELNHKETNETGYTKMKTLFKIIIIVALVAIAVKFSGVTNLKMANFVTHGVIKTMNIGIDEIGLDKEACEEYAKSIIENNMIEGMSEKDMAKEIYAHIFLNAYIESLPDALKNTSIISRLHNSTQNGIDLEDYGDTFVRQAAYSMIWAMV